MVQVRDLTELALKELWQGVKVKRAGGVKKQLVLCAYGTTAPGQRGLVSFRQASPESEAQWLAFLQDVYNRGLEGKQNNHWKTRPLSGFTHFT